MNSKDHKEEWIRRSELRKSLKRWFSLYMIGLFGALTFSLLDMMYGTLVCGVLCVAAGIRYRYYERQKWW